MRELREKLEESNRERQELVAELEKVRRDVGEVDTRGRMEV